MAGTIKGITIQLGADTTKLSAALNSANKAIRATQTSLRDVEKALKFSPGNVDLLKDKQALLSQKIQETKTKLDALKQGLAKMDAQGVDKTSKEYVELKTKMDLCESELKQLESEMKNFGSVGAQQVAAVGEKMKSVGSALSDAGGKLTKSVTLPIVGIGTAAVKTAADFESSMSNVQAISGASGDEMAQLTDKAREMGASTKFSASEAADAMSYMAMAGWKSGQMIDGIGGIMDLAAASGEDLATTSDIVTDALTAFGLGAKDSSHFADILASASSNANTNVSMLGESFKYVAPMAGSLGFSAEDTSIALGLMANSGIKASQAGTSLRTILANMSDPTDTVAAAMDRLGLSLDDGYGNMYSFRQIMDQMREGFGQLKLSDDEFSGALVELNGQLESGEIDMDAYSNAVFELMERANGAEGALQAQTAAELAGKTGLSGLLAIVNASEDDYNKLTAAIDNCTYQLDDISAAVEKSGIDMSAWAERGLDSGNVISGMVDDVIYNIDTLGTSTGDILEYLQSEYDLTAEDAKTALETIVQGMEDSTGAAEAMADIMQDNLNGQVTELKSALEEAGISIGNVFIPKIKEVVEKIKEWTDKFNSLDDKTKKIIVTIGLAVAAIGPLLLIVGKALIFIGQVMTFAPMIVTAFSAVSGFFTATLVPAIGGVVSAIVPMIAAFAPFIAIGAAVVAAGVLIYKNWDTIKQKAGELMSAVKEKFDAIKGAVSEKLEAAREVAGKVWDAMKTTAANSMDAVKSKYDEHGGGLRGAVAATMEAYKQCHTAAFNFVDNLTGGKLSNILNTVKTKMDGVKDKVSSALESVRQFFQSKLDAAKSTVDNTLGAIRNYFSEKLNAARDTASSVLGSIRDKFTEIFNGIKSYLKPVIDWLKGIFDFEWKLPEIKLPHFKISGSFSLDPPSVPSFSLDWYDKGGIFSSPTVIGVGEKRPEFVGALDDLRAIVREESGGGALMQEVVRLMTVLVEQGGRPITVNQEIYADSTSYVEQQRQAARSFKNIARAI